MEILLKREEVSPERQDNSGQIPLSFAALYRHEVVVKILLGREEVNPKIQIITAKYRDAMPLGVGM